MFLRPTVLLATIALLPASPLQPSAASDMVVAEPVAGPPATVQSMCAERSVMVEALSRRFSEAPMAVGMVDQNAVVEVFVSPEGSWTILTTGANGKSCVLLAGEGFESNLLVRGIDS